MGESCYGDYYGLPRAAQCVTNGDDTLTEPRLEAALGAIDFPCLQPLLIKAELHHLPSDFL